MARLFSIAAGALKSEMNGSLMMPSYGSIRVLCLASMGEDFERINVACPRKILEEGLESWRRAYEAKGF